MAELNQKMTDHHLPGVVPGKAVAFCQPLFPSAPLSRAE